LRGAAAEHVGARRRTAAGSPEFAYPALPESVQAAVWPRVECAACVVHLWGYRGSGRPGVVGAKAEVGAHGGTTPACARAGCWGAMAKTTSAKVQRGTWGAHRAWKRSEMRRRGESSARSVAAMGRSSRSGRCWVPPSSWAAWVDEWLRCEAEQGVREGRGPLVVRNHHGGREFTSSGADAIPA